MRVPSTVISFLLLAGCALTPSTPATAELQSCINIIPDEIHFTAAEQQFLHGMPELYIKLVEQQRQIHWAKIDEGN